MGQALPVQPHPETALADKPPVLGYGFEMLPRFHAVASRFFGPDMPHYNVVFPGVQA